MRLNFKNKNKNAVFSLSLILLLAMTLMMAFAQTSLAQIGIAQPEKTTGYISVAPTLIGVGQTLTVNTWILPLPTTYFNSPNWEGFYGLTVTFTRPDGTKDTFMPTDGTGVYPAGVTQSLGALYFFYSPNMAGNWSVSFTMPAQNITAVGTIPSSTPNVPGVTSNQTVQYLGCTSNTATFTVQTDTVLAGLLNGYPWAELPNSNVYWSYPINSNNREWSAISGDWTGVALTVPSVMSPTYMRWQPYGSGPSTAHIVWDDPIKAGGLIGGAYGSYTYMSGITSATAFLTTVIMDGKAYVDIPNTTPLGGAVGKFECIDESTGQVMYVANGTFSCGIHMTGNAYIQATTPGNDVVLASSAGNDYVSYLYGTQGTNMNFYDPITGNLLRTIVNATAVRLYDGTALIGYGAANATLGSSTYGGWLFRWNMSAVATTGATANNFNTGITWKVPLPLTLLNAYPAIFAISPDQSTIVLSSRQQYWGYSATTGALLWNITLPYPVISNEELPLDQVNDFFVWDAVAGTFHLYSELTGAQLWESSSFSSSPWATTYTVYYTAVNDLNNLYQLFPDGTAAALSLATGNILWRSTAFASTEYPNNVIPYVCNGLVLVGGNLYTYAGYSNDYTINPVPRFAMTVCINATTGDITWTLNGGVTPDAAANGYLLGTGIYDGRLYCLGKGQTTTTVTAQQQVGGSVLIQGSVLDQSAAQPDTPAISDADMSVWMDYLHMQNSTLLNNPPQCTGVPVTLTAVDPNGNTMNIGTTTSNNKGTYGFQWTPTTTGLYTIYANFAGSDSYYTSSAATYATVASVSSSSPVPTSGTEATISNSNMLMYFAAGVVVIIIAIAIATVLILRKK